MSDLAPVSLSVGMMAHYDTTFSGLIPCKVEDFRKLNGRWEAQVRLTAGHGGYRRGEVLWVNASDVPPRDKRCVYRRDYKVQVRNTWHVLHNTQRHDIFASATG